MGGAATAGGTTLRRPVGVLDGSAGSPCCLADGTASATSRAVAGTPRGAGATTKGGADTGPSPVDRRKRGSKHHLICDGRGTPLKVITTAANVNDVTQTLALVDGVPPVAGRPGRPRRRPEALLGDKGYDSNPNRDELRKRRILPVISRKGSPNVKGLGKLRYVVEQTFALLHQFKRLAVRWERRTELHNAFASLACSLICWRRLKKTSHDRATSSEHGHR
ncbi:IS5 family transposase [Streptomyces sp. enrichment culture]|uniref:IS5 family transposase n=1 Tax=Streptomyces sp. enrichment culture TaxID=1795815 RepID=UPI003F5733F7